MDTDILAVIDTTWNEKAKMYVNDAIVENIGI